MRLFRRRAPAGATATTVRYVADVVVTLDEHGTVHRPGAVEVTGDRIGWVGPASASAQAAPSASGAASGAASGPATASRPGAGGGTSAAVAVVEVGGLLMPGLVNVHGHSAMTLLRGAGDGLALGRWLQEVVWPREALLCADDVRWGMTLGCAELLRAGVTTTCEQYLHPRAVADAVADAGIRCVLTPVIFDLPGAGPDATWQRCLDDAGSLHAEMDGRGGRLTVGLGPHSAYALPEDALKAIARTAGELGALVQIHVAETRDEGSSILRRHGCSAPELLERLGVLDNRVLAAHSVWLSDHDLDIYAAHNVAVGHCPQSNAKLGSGIARVGEMLARGVRVGLGTDGPASNDNLDLWEELRLAPLLARAATADAGAITTHTALGLGTHGGADALGLRAGRLAPGYFADLVRVDTEDAAFVPGLTEHEILSHLVWAASSRLVTDVWVGGRRVVDARRCTTVDERLAREEVRLRARRLAGV